MIVGSSHPKAAHVCCLNCVLYGCIMVAEGLMTVICCISVMIDRFTESRYKQVSLYVY